MPRFRPKRTFKRLLYSPVVLVPLALIVFFLGTSVWNIYTKERQTRDKRVEQTEKLEALQTRATALEVELNRLSTERGREEEIRSKFEVAREGEHVMVIVDPREEEEVLKQSEDKSWWRRLLSWF